MAKPSKSKGETKITRIKASDSSRKDSKPVAITPEKVKKDKKQLIEVNINTVSTKKPRGKNIFSRIWTYFKGAWSELRQVRWPDRKATWSMTGALLVFTLFFVLAILVLDYGFSQLFKLILGS